jgi:hypothetical protein
VYAVNCSSRIPGCASRLTGFLINHIFRACMHACMHARAVVEEILCASTTPAFHRLPSVCLLRILRSQEHGTRGKRSGLISEHLARDAAGYSQSAAKSARNPKSTSAEQHFIEEVQETLTGSDRVPVVQRRRGGAAAWRPSAAPVSVFHVPVTCAASVSQCSISPVTWRTAYPFCSSEQAVKPRAQSPLFLVIFFS